MKEDTIAAISTALGVGAISIIRMSGDEAISVVSSLTHQPKLLDVPSHTIHYAHIYEEENVIDEVLISIMRAPKTFTKEDVVEINCHGGIATTNKVLELILRKGVRLAEAGEFTKRAFLNGRINLIEAEGIMNLINAESEKARQLSINQVTGKVTNLIENLRKEILETLASIEVNIDYPEYDDAITITHDVLKPRLKNVKAKMKQIIEAAENGRLMNQGIKTAIIGKPNVGKSSLLNALLEEEKAIVTDIAGTTRDIVEGKLTFRGITLNIIDTAGIRDTNDIVEQIGVQKSKKIIEEADLVLAIFDNSRPTAKEDLEILKQIKNHNYLILLNKIDLETKFDLQAFENSNYIACSVKEQKGLEEIKDAIFKIFQIGTLSTDNFSYLSTARQIALAKEAYQHLLDALNSIEENVPIEMVDIDLQECWTKLGNIIGVNYSEELIDQLFSQFCLGK